MSETNQAMRSCQTCRYWLILPLDKEPMGNWTAADAGKVGRCKRYPPTPASVSSARGIWPETWLTDSCGEWSSGHFEGWVAGH